MCFLIFFLKAEQHEWLLFLEKILNEQAFLFTTIPNGWPKFKYNSGACMRKCSRDQVLTYNFMFFPRPLLQQSRIKNIFFLYLFYKFNNFLYAISVLISFQYYNYTFALPILLTFTRLYKILANVLKSQVCALQYS